MCCDACPCCVWLLTCIQNEYCLAKFNDYIKRVICIRKLRGLDDVNDNAEFNRKWYNCCYIKLRGLLTWIWGSNSHFLEISIVIDSDRGHCYKNFKKVYLRWKLSAWHVFECSCVWWIFELPEMEKKWSFELFRPNMHELGLFHPVFYM